MRSTPVKSAPPPQAGARGKRGARLAWRIWAFAAAALWLGVIYALPLRSLQEARQASRAQLTALLHASTPNPAEILDNFDQASQNILFAASGPYLILAIATLFLTAHLVHVKRRLNAAEHNIQMLRDVALGLESPFRQ